MLKWFETGLPLAQQTESAKIVDEKNRNFEIVTVGDDDLIPNDECCLFQLLSQLRVSVDVVDTFRVSWDRIS